jgi:hypothetical protein
MRPIHAAFVLLALVVAIGGAYFVIRADESSAQVASAAPASAVEPMTAPVAEETSLQGKEGLGDPGVARVASSVEPKAAPEAPAADEGDGTGSSLSGRVIDPFGNPVAGASVYAAKPSPWNKDVALHAIDSEESPWVERTEAVTDDRGRFAIDVADAARSRVAVRAGGFVPYDGEHGVAIGETFDVGDVVLEESVLLSGRVTDRDGRGVVGAELRQRQQGGVRWGMMGARGTLLATTGDQGRFELNELAAGPWRIMINHEVHPLAEFAGETSRPGEAQTGLQFVLEDGLEIHGRVVDAPPETLAMMQVVASPEVDLDSLGEGEPTTRRIVPVEDDGSFIVRGLREGVSYRLQGREATERSFDFFGRSLTAAVTAEPGARGVELEHLVETALVFQVVDHETGLPLERFDVAAGLRFPMPMRGDSGRSVREHPEGRVRFTALRPTPGNDHATLRVEATGYETFERSDITVSAGIDTDIGIVRLEKAPTVTVTVVEETTGKPISRARVRLEEVRSSGPGSFTSMTAEISVDSDDHDHPALDDLELPMLGGSESARTNKAGVATLTSMPGKEVQIVVRGKGFAPYKSEPMTLPIGKDLEYDVRHGLGGAVLVLVVDPDGNPAAGEKVAHDAPGDDGMGLMFGGRPKTTDADGELLFENLELGTHSFRLGEDDNSAVTLNSGGGTFSMVRRVQRSGGPEPEESDRIEVDVVAGGYETVTLVAKRRSAVIGRVTEAGMSLAGATVSLVEAGAVEMPDMGGFGLGGGGPEVRTNGSGEYELAEVEVGEYTLRVTHPSRTMPYEQPLEVVDGGSELDIDLPTTVIRGRITDKEGEPLVGVRVRPERHAGGQQRVQRQVMIMMTDDGDGEGTVISGDNSFEPVLTNENGEYELRGVQSDVELVVKATGDGVQPGSSKPVRLMPGDLREGLDFELLPGGELVVEVLRPDGSGAAMCMITAEYEDEEGVEAKNGFTNRSGKATLDGLRPGNWRVSARQVGLGGNDSAGEDPEMVVEVVAGENEPARLQQP